MSPIWLYYKNIPQMFSLPTAKQVKSKSSQDAHSFLWVTIWFSQQPLNGHYIIHTLQKTNGYRGQITWLCVTTLVSGRGRSWTQADLPPTSVLLFTSVPLVKSEKKKNRLSPKRSSYDAKFLLCFVLLICLPKRSTSFAVLCSCTNSLT